MYNCLMRLKILLIDDDPFQVAVLEEVVKEFGHNVFTATTSGEAVELVASHFARLSAFDVIFIGYPLPDDDINTLSLKIKEIDPHNITIAVTDDNSVEARLELVRCRGLDGFINKASEVSYVKRYLDIAMSQKKKNFSKKKSIYKERLNKIQKI